MRLVTVTTVRLAILFWLGESEDSCYYESAALSGRPF